MSARKLLLFAARLERLVVWDGGTSASCADDATWSYGTKASNTCAYVARKLKRCKAKNTDGVRTALEACPKTCGTC